MKKYKKRNYKVLELLADDLVSSIQQCAPSWMRHPTAHMDIAVNNYLVWKSENSQFKKAAK